MPGSYQMSSSKLHLFFLLLSNCVQLGDMEKGDIPLAMGGFNGGHQEDLFCHFNGKEGGSLLILIPRSKGFRTFRYSTWNMSSVREKLCRPAIGCHIEKKKKTNLYHPERMREFFKERQLTTIRSASNEEHRSTVQ